ncbi:MAG: 30S ribosomal protein S14 [DPANN group archaeon]|nr:30S ribosomal protein S14 [DPANN group archaeon]
MKQLKGKKNKINKFKKHNKPIKRDYGKAQSVCRQCDRKGRGIINKYGLKYCRQCFKEIAKTLGFSKYN